MLSLSKDVSKDLYLDVILIVFVYLLHIMSIYSIVYSSINLKTYDKGIEL